MAAIYARLRDDARGRGDVARARPACLAARLQAPGDFRASALLAALRLAAPVLVFTAATVGVQMAVNLFGSRFGGVEKLYYAFVVFQLRYGVFVVAIATALVPELSERFTAATLTVSARTSPSGSG